MLLSRAISATKVAPRSELHTVACSLLPTRQPQQLTTLTRFAAISTLTQTPRHGSTMLARSFASDSDDSPPLPLKEALKAELIYEHDNFERDETLPAEPPAPWTLTESPGDSELKLVRHYNDETIEVRVMADECSEDEDEQVESMLEGAQPSGYQDHELSEAVDEAISVAILASARIIKGGRSIDFNLRTDGSYMQVIDVSLGEPDVTDAPGDTSYAGPKYDELDDRVQVAFDEYIAQRGIDAEFGEYLMKLTADKEQREYIGWLQKVHDFV